MSAFSDVELLQDFLTEAGDLLEDVDSKLVELEQSPEDADLLATVFRGFHTIKGGAGFLEATHLVELCHKTENLFDLLRSKKLVLDAEMMDSIMAATGEVHRMFGEMRNGHQPGAAPQELLEALDAAIEGRTVAPAAAPVVQVAAAVPAPSQPKTLNELAQISEDDLDWAGLYEAVVGVPPRELEQAALSTGMATEAIARQAAAAVRPKAPPPKAKAAQPAAAVQKENTIRVDTARFDQILNL
ncbi:MAG TPA: chemotaxis protein CheA, partial [Limnobacter sp.]|nr:chemotaxis protein CheA [Limnobacter sp.]